MLGTMLIQQVVFASLGLWLAVRMGVWDTAILAPTWWAFWAGLGLAGGLILLAEVSLRLFPIAMERMDQIMLQFWSKIDLDWTPFTVISLSIGAGVGEELLFRAAVQGIFVDYLPLGIALILAALLFGLMHWIRWEYVLATAAIGLLFGVVFYLTGSLLLVIIAHTVYDMWALRRLGARLSVVP